MKRCWPRLLKWSLEQVLKGLYQLHKFQIVCYDPQKETPQIYYNQPRRKSGDIRIDEKMYLFRKDQFVKRVNGILAYVQTDSAAVWQLLNISVSAILKIVGSVTTV